MFIDTEKNTINSTMPIEIDIFENDIREQYPDVLKILLKDQTTKENIFWATDNYNYLGKDYEYNSQVLPELITGENGKVIMPRVSKMASIQQTRVRDMAEVFTPSWICNAQNNLIDNAWFGYNNAFNTELIKIDGTHAWQTNSDKIAFPQRKTWLDYIKDTRLEIACGEAPYITSRHDTTTGIFIPVEKRIGLLDRKLRIINENTEIVEEWHDAAKTAFENIYAYEWHGDSLLLAREAMLFTYIEFHVQKFGKEPPLPSIKQIAHIISWNIWQMDGLKGVVPNSCVDKKETTTNLLGEIETFVLCCEGCKRNNIKKHNGVYCTIMDWEKKEEIKFINLIN